MDKLGKYTTLVNNIFITAVFQHQLKLTIDQKWHKQVFKTMYLLKSSLIRTNLNYEQIAKDFFVKSGW